MREIRHAERHYGHCHQQQQQIDHEERRHEIGEMQRVLGETLHKVTAVERIAPELAQMRTKQRAPMVIHNRPWVIDDAAALVAHDRTAEKRILARPEVGAVAAELAEERRAHE